MEEEFELEYSPSKWVLRLPANQVVLQHVEVVTQASETARKTVPHTLNIRYGKRERQLFDLYGTDLPKGSPIFVYVHGGFWQELDKDVSAYPAIPLWRAGIRCVVVGYDLAPKVTVNEIVEEARELATFILTMAKEENCGSVWFGGHSAGAHLCASLLDADWFNGLTHDLRRLLKGVVLISGIYDLTPLVHTSNNDPLQLDRPNALRLSPMFKLKQLQPVQELKAMIVVGEHDSPAFHGQSKAYYEILKKKKKTIKAYYKEIMGRDVDHFTVVENLQYPSNELTQDIIRLIVERPTMMD